MTEDTREDIPGLLSAADIVRYLRATGWAHGRQGSHGAMWTKGDVEFSVPHEDHNPAWLREVVGRLASAEGRTLEATAAAIAAYRDAGAATKACGCSPLGPCGTHLGRGSVASVSTSAVTSPAPAPPVPPATATEPAEAGSDAITDLKAERDEAQSEAAMIRGHANRFLRAVYGPDVVYRAPETFSNLLERWIWAVGAGVPEIAHACIADIERQMAALGSDGAGNG